MLFHIHVYARLFLLTLKNLGPALKATLTLISHYGTAMVCKIIIVCVSMCIISTVFARHSVWPRPCMTYHTLRVLKGWFILDCRLSSTTSPYCENHTHRVEGFLCVCTFLEHDVTDLIYKMCCPLKFTKGSKKLSLTVWMNFFYLTVLLNVILSHDVWSNHEVFMTIKSKFHILFLT